MIKGSWKAIFFYKSGSITLLGGKHMEREINAIDYLLDEIEQNLKNQKPISALIFALMVPDICAKILHPSIDSSHQRYRMFYEDNIGKYNQSPLANENPDWERLPYLSGYVAYQLRCKIFHEGENYVHAKDYYTDEVFLITSKDLCGSSCLRIDDNGKKHLTLEVNIWDFCIQIVETVRGMQKRGEFDGYALPTLKIKDEVLLYKSML